MSPSSGDGSGCVVVTPNIIKCTAGNVSLNGGEVLVDLGL